MMPRLLVEALAAGNDSGLGRHVRLFVQALGELTHRFEVHVLWPKGIAYAPPPGVHVHIVSPWFMRFWIEVMLPWHRLRLQPEAVLHLGYTLPRLRSSAPSLLLVPDAGPLENRTEAGALRMSLNVAKNRRAMLRQLPRASRLMVSTPFTVNRLQALLGLGLDRMVAVPPYGAYTLAWSQEGREDREIAARYSAGYLLCVGNIEPRKNHMGLLRAYAWAVAQADEGEKMPPLVCVGHQAWDEGKTHALARSLGLGERVHFTGHISDALLGAYLRGATAFVTASLYEGFGMPLFEAMCLGKACIYHQGTSHDDFAAGAAWAVDTTHPEALGKAMLALAQNENLRLAYAAKAKAMAQKALDFDVAEALNAAITSMLGPVRSRNGWWYRKP
jgi:glycosyltransferase involved in cell wall biosynthesis